MQQGRLKDAARWWDYLVDVRGESDFQRYRRSAAEAETGKRKEAQRRIEAIMLHHQALSTGTRKFAQAEPC